ncbi:zinc finger protein ZAT6-like [Musa acuminata AAA Group]|uniref:zinc finger protein ZAT6-like n=1 Tax=Musa acuminata AAA Group TaxID=214697 RepID=UPI0031D3EDC8
MVQRIVVEQFVAMRYTQSEPVRDLIIWRHKTSHRKPSSSVEEASASGLFHGKRKRHRGGLRRRQGAPVLGVPEDVSIGASAGGHKRCHNDGNVGNGTTPAAMTSSEGASSRHRAFYLIAPASPNPEFDDVNGVQSLSTFKKPRPVIPA